jgi:hypothetical protein
MDLPYTTLPPWFFFLDATRWKLQLSMFKHPLEPLRTTVLPSASQPPWNINFSIYKFITVIQYLSLAYQAYHCSTMLLCSPVSVSLYLHILAISDILFLSTRAPQPSFSVSLSFYTHALRFLCFCLLCSVFHVYSMHHSSSLYFSCCTLLNSSQQQHPSLLCSAFL